MTSIETKKSKDKMMTALFTCGAAFAVVLLIAFVLYVVVSGVSGMTPQLLSFTGAGLGNMFFNTIYLVVLALVASAIIGIPAGIFLAEYAKKGRITHWSAWLLKPWHLCVYRRRLVRLLGLHRHDRFPVEPHGRCFGRIHSDLALGYVGYRRCSAQLAVELPQRQFGPRRLPLADHLARSLAGLLPPYHDRPYHGCRPWFR